MKIHTINKAEKYRIKNNFKAIDYAKATTVLNGIKNEFRIYELEYSDRVFLDTMSGNINLEKILPEKKTYNRKQLKTWKNIIDNAIMMSAFSYPERAFLITKDNRPCGIMSYQNSLNGKMYLDNIAVWPHKKGEGQKLAGQTLMKILFLDALENNIKNIGLSLANDFSEQSKKFYEKLKFRSLFDTNTDVDMVSSSLNYKASLEESEDLIRIEKKATAKHQDLNKLLDIKY